ncbi:MAG: transcriptional repressor LexA [Dialister sp.]|nr:transcriptional repressor LexA [Dialister sp.]MDU7052471.1 transcriptional repressor LexA [Dialister sp.]
MHRELTTREKTILDFIRNKIWQDGFPPTVREICTAVGLRSTSTVHGYLARLEEMGMIKKDPASSRAIEVVDDNSWRKKKMVPMPMVGAVRAGEPIVADEHIESVYPLPAEFIGNDSNCFILVVRGDSMINAGIQEGDYLIVAEQETARNGDIVVALVGNDDATVKRFFREADHIRLQPENEDYEPIISRDVKIRGRVIGLYRHL